MITADAISRALDLREKRLEASQEAYERCVNEARMAEVTYRLAEAKAAMLANGTNAEKRKAEVMVATAQEFEAWRIADGLERSSKSALDTARALLDAGRTRASSLRTEMTLATSGLRT